MTVQDSRVQDAHCMDGTFYACPKHPPDDLLDGHLLGNHPEGHPQDACCMDGQLSGYTETSNCANVA